MDFYGFGFTPQEVMGLVQNACVAGLVLGALAALLGLVRVGPR